ncbi:MAG: ABC transporter ATP-binding protein [Gemmatimonadota bacterium]|nr:ABC transporter ATP-binding protein [Gemmatimonadota bacterium]
MKRRRNRYFALLICYLKPQWPRVLAMALLLFGGIGLQLVNPLIMRFFIDTATEGGSLRQLTRAGLLFIGVGLVHQAVSAFASYVCSDVSWRATNRLRSNLTGHILSLDMSFHHSRTPGELIERVDGDVGRLAAFFSDFVIELVGGLMLSLGVLTVLMFEDWRLGAILAAFVAVYLTVHIRAQMISVPFWHAERQASAELSGFLEERLSGLRDIRANGATTYTMRRFHEAVRRAFATAFKADVITDVGWSISNIVFAAGFASAMAYGAYLYRADVITIGTVYLLIHYFQMLHTPLNRIQRQVEAFQSIRVGIQRVEELTSIRPEIPDGPGTILPTGPLTVECRNLCFSYQPEKPVLQDLTFRLEPGKVLGLLGRTGSGKTTLSRLLFRLCDACGGSIRLSGTDIREPRLSDLRAHVGLVTQDVQLFQASVRDNLTLFDGSIGDNRVIDALHVVGLGAWYASLPLGLDSQMLPGGGGLSAGEAQLVAFARVFLRNPGLLILDEASSRLDAATERRMQHAMDALLRDRTAIVIAHRLSTVYRADEIMILEEGRLREHGSYANLVKNPDSIFSGLLRTGLEGVLR